MGGLQDCGHGMPTTVEEVKDYHKRILAWYDSHLKDDLKKKVDEQKLDASHERDARMKSHPLGLLATV